MKRVILTAALLGLSSAPAYAIGNCNEPSQISIPPNAAQLSMTEFKTVHEKGEAYMASAQSYLSCLNKIIYSYPPEDPIVNKAGHAHANYAEKWVPVWSELNLACSDWQALHGQSFPNGCTPTTPQG